MRWMLYGAYGYTGRLIAELAVERGSAPVLAGRNGDRTRALADRLGLEHRVFGLTDPDMARNLEGMDAVLHSAGPFSATFRPVVEACLDAGVHYLDITGEIDVLEALHGMDDRARDAGIVLLPAVGFDVVPTDCAAAQAAAMIESPTHLEIAFVASGSPSRGTARTTIESLGKPGKERRAGMIVDVSTPARARIPFTDRPRDAVSIPWGDVSTAWYSTGVPNIRVFLAMRAVPGWLGKLGPLLRTGIVRRLLRWQVDRRVTGPDERQLREGHARVRCAARNAAGDSGVVEITTPNGYTLTADAALTAVTRLLSADYGGPRTGALTPSMAFGARFVNELRGVRRVLPAE